MQYIGLDVHKNSIYATVLDNKGRIVLKQEIPNDKLEIIRFFSTGQMARM
jgi:predicted NBD/HSP70 family sugar kinase